ncbi:MAG: FAD:protein FMN transferase [Anaerolineales bacterium]
MEKISFKAMGCQMMAALDSDSRRGSEVLNQVPEWFEAWEQCLSRFRADSELSQLNALAGQAVQVSRTLWDVFQAARRAAAATQGLITPVVLDAMVRSGYDRSFDQLPANGTAAPAAARLMPATVRDVLQDEQTHTLRLPAGMHLDFGGIAKGWAAEQAVRRLKPYGPALVDAGGDIAVSGLLSSGEPWPVGVEIPGQPGSEAEILLVGRGGIATSGIDYRRWQQDGKWQHHIIDPRTMQPAETDVLSVTVIARDLTTAEAAAKTTLILGSGAGLRWLEAQPGCAGLLVQADGTRLYSQAIQSYLWSETWQTSI